MKAIEAFESLSGPSTLVENPTELQKTEAAALKFYHLWESAVFERDDLRNSVRELLASIRVRSEAKEVFRRAIDTGSDRWAEAQLIRADRRYSKAILACKNLIHEHPSTPS